MGLDYAALDDGRGCSYWTYDPVLRREVRRTVPDEEFEWVRDRLADFGEVVGTTMADNSDVVDDNPPELRTHDRDGNLVNEVDYHPAQLENERLMYEAGTVADSFRAPPDRADPVSLVHNLAMGYLVGAVDVGLDCPMAMTAGAALVLERHGDDVHEPFLEGLLAREYEALLQGAMFLTEKQGGSDVGKAETTAEHVAGRTYELAGEKWFCSNVDAGCVLTLARRPGDAAGTDGLSLFVLPRETRDGEGNDYYFRRLKDKLGTKSVPTGEVELRGAEASLVGEPERGFTYMAEMLNMERLHNAVGSVGVMARALLESRVHVEHREAFGGPLAEKPLMRRDLVEMAVDHEAAAAFSFDAARAFDRRHRGDDGAIAETGGDDSGDATGDGIAGDSRAYRLMRILVPVAKHRTGRMAVDHASYAIEIQGGNGYVSDWVTHRLLRDAQVLPVWEGTSNVLSLDVLRAMSTEAAHEVALDRIDDYLADLDDRLEPTGAVVRERRSDLADAVDALATADREVAERDAKAFADLLFDVYAAAVLLAEADRDLTPGSDDRGDARKALVARNWVARHLRDEPGRDIGGQSLAVEHFEAVNYHERVDPGVLDEPVAAD